MAAISTKELFDAYFSSRTSNAQKKIRGQVDRPEVYAYEQKIGKQLIEMNEEELFGMIETFGNQRNKGTGYSISYSSYPQLASIYRAIWNYYIENYEVIRNPWYNQSMRGAEAAKRLSSFKEPFTLEKLNEIISTIHADVSDQNRANYLECILLLYYGGFYNAEEIVKLKESDIDFENKTVSLPGRTIQLSDRCFDLLCRIHSLTEMAGWRGDLLMEPYKEGYFKYIIRPKEEGIFNLRTEAEVANLINRRVAIDINRKYGYDVNYKLLYFLGAYNKLCEECGEKRAEELIRSIRNSKDADELMNFAKSYGIPIDNVSILKKNLLPYI